MRMFAWLGVSPRGVVPDDGALLISQVLRPPGVESLKEQVNVPGSIHLQALIRIRLDLDNEI